MSNRNPNLCQVWMMYTNCLGSTSAVVSSGTLQSILFTCYWIIPRCLGCVWLYIFYFYYFLMDGRMISRCGWFVWLPILFFSSIFQQMEGYYSGVQGVSDYHHEMAGVPGRTDYHDIHSILVDGGDRFGVSALCFDKQDLLWMGNSGVGI